MMGIGPTYAIPRVLELTGLTIDDVDLFEVRAQPVEAFCTTHVLCTDQ